MSIALKQKQENYWPKALAKPIQSLTLIPEKEEFLHVRLKEECIFSHSMEKEASKKKGVSSDNIQ
jgi:hypothetical protein